MKVVCFIIHGIGEQNQRFSNSLRQGITRELRRTKAGTEAERSLEFHNLYWANEGSDYQDQIYRKIYPELYTKKGRIQGFLQFLDNLGWVRPLTFHLIGDVFKYLGKYQKPIKEAVLRQVTKVLSEKQKKNEAISLIVIGHSLGSVIMHDLVSGFLEYNYAAFEKLIRSTTVITMGSPLSLFSLVADSADPKMFRSWRNFLHPKDPIAAPMGMLYEGVEDIALKSSSGARLMPHGSYWTDADMHRRIAAEIQQHLKENIGIALGPEDLRSEAPPEIFQPFQTAATKVGFSQYLPNFDKIPFEELFSTRKHVDVCLVYGGTWVQKHAQYIASALEKPSTDMRVCMLSPESASVGGLAYQFNASGEEDLRDRARKSTQALIDAFQLARKNREKKGKTGQLRIYHSLNGITHGFFRFDDLIYFSPRQMTGNKLATTPIPTIVFRGKYPPSKKDEMGYDMYSWLMRDFEMLLKETREATLVFDSQTAKPAK